MQEDCRVGPGLLQASEAANEAEEHNDFEAALPDQLLGPTAHALLVAFLIGFARRRRCRGHSDALAGIEWPICARQVTSMPPGDDRASLPTQGLAGSPTRR